MLKKILLVVFVLFGCVKQSILSLKEIEDSILKNMGNEYEVFTIDFDKEEKEYEAILYNKDCEVELSINAYNGKILSKEVEKAKKIENEIYKEYIEKAISFYGLKEEEVSFIQIEEEKDYSIYEVSFYYKGNKYHCEYDIESKNLLNTEIE